MSNYPEIPPVSADAKRLIVYGAIGLVGISFLAWLYFRRRSNRV